MKTIAAAIMLILIANLCYAQQEKEWLYHYESNQTIPIDLDSTVLKKALLQPIDSIVLIGHTDDVGSTAANLELSRQRVEYWENYLLGLNADKYLIKTHFYGEEQPKSDNRDALSRSKNRRVKMIVYTSGNRMTSIASMDSIEIVTEVDIQDNTELYAYLRSEVSPQIFTILNAADTVIETNDGVFIYFPKHCFRSDCDSIEIVIEEYNDKRAMIFSNVQTLSNNRLIYSDGMLDLKAYCNEVEVTLNSRRKYTMLLPVNNKEGVLGAKGFYGTRDSLTSQVNWITASPKDLDVFGGLSFWGCGPKSCWFFNLFRSRQNRMARASLEELNKERQRIRDKYRDVDFDEFEGMLKSDLEFYVFQANRMGLINVDYFWKTEQEDIINQRIELTEPITKNCDLMMVFKGRRSLQTRVEKTKRYFEFMDVPKGEEVQIVALKYAKEGGIRLKVQEITIGSSEDVIIELEPVSSLERVDEILGQLN